MVNIYKYLFILLLCLFLNFNIYSNDVNINTKTNKNNKLKKVHLNIKFSKFDAAALLTNNQKKLSKNNIDAIGKSTKQDLMKLGRNFFAFGIICGSSGGILIGVGFIISWILSKQINWTFKKTIGSIFISYTLFGNYSNYASIIISMWVVGGILAGLFLLIIPGIILMSIGSTRISKIILPIHDGIGIKVRF